jgi:cell division protein FtsL
MMRRKNMSRLVLSLLLVAALVMSISGVAALAADTDSVDGKITKLDKGNVTIQTADKKDTVVTVNDATKVKVDGKAAKAADLKVGMKAKASCKKDGTKHVAVSIDASKA